jgi:hypothetical protein
MTPGDTLVGLVACWTNIGVRMDVQPPLWCGDHGHRRRRRHFRPQLTFDLHRAYIRLNSSAKIRGLVAKQQMQTVMEALRLSRELTSRLRLGQAYTRADMDRLDALLYQAIDNLDHEVLPNEVMAPIPEGEITVESYQINPPQPVGLWITVAGKTVAVLTIDDVKEAVKHYDRMVVEYRAAHPGAALP